MPPRPSSLLIRYLPMKRSPVGGGVGIKAGIGGGGGDGGGPRGGVWPGRPGRPRAEERLRKRILAVTEPTKGWLVVASRAGSPGLDRNRSSRREPTRVRSTRIKFDEPGPGYGVFGAFDP